LIGFVILSFLTVTMGCAEWNRTQKGAAIGAGAGGAAGAPIGYATGATVAGIIIGAAVGVSPAVSSEIIWTSRRLKSKGTFRGPKLRGSAKASKLLSAQGFCLTSIKQTLKMTPRPNWRSYPQY
jgi:hypothetical protein